MSNGCLVGSGHLRLYSVTIGSREENEIAEHANELNNE